MENQSPQPCPYLPASDGPMTYRDLQEARQSGADSEHRAALAYAQYLWVNRLPGRAILSLCRALYLDPSRFQARHHIQQPYLPYRWMLAYYTGLGFLGNPRYSFANQATRISAHHSLKILRAWAMWHLTRAQLPALPPGPSMEATAPNLADLIRLLNLHGHSGEGDQLHQAMQHFKG